MQTDGWFHCRGLKLNTSDRHLCSALVGFDQSAATGVAISVAIDFEGGWGRAVSRVIRKTAAPGPLPRKCRLPATQTKTFLYTGHPVSTQ